jgi:hypothetical protein
MKKIYLFVLMVLCVGLFAQAKGTIMTDHLIINTMVWSEYDEEYVFIPNKERHIKMCRWSFELVDETDNGLITMVDVMDKTEYRFYVNHWDLAEDKEMIMCDVIEAINGNESSIYILKNDRGEHMITVFMPQAELSLFFDNME